MGAFALLALVGFGILFASSGDSANDLDTTEGDSDTDGEETTFIGTDDNDVVLFFEDDDGIVLREGFVQTGEEPNDTPVGNVTRIELEAGDDYAFSIILSGAEMYGGAGEDTLTGATRSILYGEDGDDNLEIWSLNGEDNDQDNFDSAA